METVKNNRSRKLFTIVSQTRLFTDQIITIREFCASASILDTRKHKKVTSNPRYFLSIALFQTQTPTTRSILDSYHDFVLASRLNFQHIHYSVFPAVVSSSFHLFQIHRLIKTRTKKIHNFYGSALDIGLAQRTVSRTNSIR